MTKVFIYPGDSYHAAIEMFERRGFEVVKDHDNLDLVVFLGGTDVDPDVYGEERGPYTQAPDKDRDYIEQLGFHKFKDRGTPMVGICRGGQLLNVLNGGKMIQHLGFCVSGDVLMEYPNGSGGFSARIVRVDHHQGIVAHKDAIFEGFIWVDDVGMVVDYVVHYPETKSLCFQPHPEWGHQGTEDYFFELIEEHLGLKGAA